MRPTTARDRAASRGDESKLKSYRSKRDFTHTAEPSGKPKTRPTRRAARVDARGMFVVQRHAARQLHFDFRLELDGALKSWAVPKGPSLDPNARRLAVQVEDHPVEYGGFEGVIPHGQYGAGEVQLWDRGEWEAVGDARAGLATGKLHFKLFGRKLRGEWILIRLARDPKHWLLRKLSDADARAGTDDAVLRERPESVATPVADSSPDAKPSAHVPMPAFIAPQLATLVATPPSGSGWVYEVKYDGYRMLAHVEDDKVSLLSRNGRYWTQRLPGIAAALRAARLGNVWLDGEIAVLGAAGHSDFQALQNALDGALSQPILFFVFDLLYARGRDLRGLPLTERSRRLHELLAALPPDGAVRTSGVLHADGAAALREACGLGLEGLIAKRLDAPYASGRNTAWLKLKCRLRQEFVIGGYTLPRGARVGFGALLLGTALGDGRLQYAGRVGTGFDDRTLAALERRLAALSSDRSAYFAPPRGARRRNESIRWVEPKLVAEVSFAGWTTDGLVRQASFTGLREDKDPRTVTREVPRDRDAPTAVPGSKAAHAAAGESVRVRGVSITHPDRVMFDTTDAAPLTKLDIAHYYDAVGNAMMSELEGRPLSLVRCPEGTRGACFFQKHLDGRHLPEGVEQHATPAGRGGDRVLLAADARAIVALAQWGVVEFHGWGARRPQLARPDRIVLDLDPDPALPWARLVEAALLARTLFETIGLRPFVKTTGGKGLHVIAPIKPTCDWSTVKGFSKALAVHLTRTFPDRFTANLAKSAREGRIFIDYLRNAVGATAVAAYSVRARPGAPVAMPLAWEELDAAEDVRGALRFDVRTVPQMIGERAGRRGPWAAYRRSAVGVKSAMQSRLNRK